jgi:hypothetical protein
MSLRSPRTDLHPAPISRTFTLTNGGASVTVADQLEASLATSPAGAPAAGINHLPSTLWLVVTTAGTFVYADILGNVNTTASIAVGAYQLPFTLKSIGDPGGTQGTLVGSLTCTWHPEA